MSGVPNLQEFGLYNWRGGGGSMWFAPVSEARGSECEKQAQLAKRILHKHGLDYVAEFIVGPRDMHHVIDVLFNRANEEELQRADACFNELLDEFGQEGYAVYRVNTRFQDRVARSYGTKSPLLTSSLNLPERGRHTCPRSASIGSKHAVSGRYAAGVPRPLISIRTKSSL